MAKIEQQKGDLVDQVIDYMAQKKESTRRGQEEEKSFFIKKLDRITKGKEIIITNCNA
ncbi:MAG TPA: hypothetical protein VGE25_09795 [Sediminibacterium sp.]|nr:hypothetical protein [Bacteroidota bacterium]